MDDKRNGPEFAPLRTYVKEFKIVVSVYDKNDKIIRCEHMNYGKYEDKVWLGRLSHWAWESGYTVETAKDEG